MKQLSNRRSASSLVPAQLTYAANASPQFGDTQRHGADRLQRLILADLEGTETLVVVDGPVLGQLRWSVMVGS
jgi:hypothetical protein